MPLLPAVYANVVSALAIPALAIPALSYSGAAISTAVSPLAPLGVGAAPVTAQARGVSMAPVAQGDWRAPDLTIIHVNDRHGRLGADAAAAALAAATPGNVLVLDAGDSLAGQVEANLTDGAAVVDVMNAVGYSAMAPGNHDFGVGLERLEELAADMDFPLLAANVWDADGDLLFDPYAVFDLDGLTACVFGVASPETPQKADPRIVMGLEFGDPAQAAKEMVAELAPLECDVTIALAHLGVDAATLPTNQSPAVAVPGVDVVIDGHSHTALESGLVEGGTLIAQAGKYGENIGVVEIWIDDGAITDKRARLIEVTDSLPVDAYVAELIAAQSDSIADVVSEVVGHTPVFLDGERESVRVAETNLANVVTDSMRYATGAEVAFLSGGNIRESIPAGDITVGQVLNTLPFSNLLVTIELTGADLLAAFEHGVAAYPEPAGDHIQLAGAWLTFDPDAEPGARVVSAATDAGPINPAAIYTVAVSEFLAAGGDGYDMLASGTGLVYHGDDAEALMDYLRTNPAISAEPEGRVTLASSDAALGATAAPTDTVPIYLALIVLAAGAAVAWAAHRVQGQRLAQEGPNNCSTSPNRMVS